jgi:transcriptional regulator with XRE-family HTH domain
MLNLGQTIRTLRKSERYSQAALAEGVGVTQGTVNFWENGQRNIPLGQAEKVAIFFGLSLSELIRIAEEDQLEVAA